MFKRTQNYECETNTMCKMKTNPAPTVNTKDHSCVRNGKGAVSCDGSWSRQIEDRRDLAQEVLDTCEKSS